MSNMLTGLEVQVIQTLLGSLVLGFLGFQSPQNIH